MPVLIAIAAFSALVSILQEAFVQTLRSPWSGIELPLLLLVALVTRLRVREAYAAAIVAGLVADALSSFPTGTRTLLAVTVATVVIALSTRVFSHRSLPGTIGITCAAYLLHRGGEYGLRLLHATIDGVPAAAADAAPLFAGLGLQLGIAIVATLFAKTTSSVFSRTFLIR